MLEENRKQNQLSKPNFLFISWFDLNAACRTATTSGNTRNHRSNFLHPRNLMGEGKKKKKSLKHMKEVPCRQHREKTQSTETKQTICT